MPNPDDPRHRPPILIDIPNLTHGFFLIGSEAVRGQEYFVYSVRKGVQASLRGYRYGDPGRAIKRSVWKSTRHKWVSGLRETGPLRIKDDTILKYAPARWRGELLLEQADEKAIGLEDLEAKIKALRTHKRPDGWAKYLAPEIHEITGIAEPFGIARFAKLIAQYRKEEPMTEWELRGTSVYDAASLARLVRGLTIDEIRAAVSQKFKRGRPKNTCKNDQNMI